MKIKTISKSAIEEAKKDIINKIKSYSDKLKIEKDMAERVYIHCSIDLLKSDLEKCNNSMKGFI